MVAAHGDHSRVNDGALLKNDEFCRTRSNIRQAYSHFTLIVAQHRIGGRQRLEHRVVDMHSSPVDCGNHILCGAGGRRDHMNANLEARCHHAQRIVHPGLIVENEFLRQQMQDLARSVGSGMARARSTACLISSRPISRGRGPKLIPP